MENSGIDLIVENPPQVKTEATTLVAESLKTKSRREKSAMKDEHEHGSSSIWSTTDEETHDGRRESFHQKWKKLFVASCFLAVFVDPLFLYVPLVNDDLKCVMLDPKLKIAALILRSVTDLFYIFDIVVQVYTTSHNFSYLSTEAGEFRGRLSHLKLSFLWKSFAPIIAKTIWGSNDVLIDILAILPLPQVTILVLVSRMRDLRTMVTVNFFVLSQYVPRVLRIYLLCKELRETPKTETKETATWVKGALNFAMYIIVSHVFGALWYFFAVQRVTVCWHLACGKGERCGGYSSFTCHDPGASRNVTLLNDYCPINPSNATIFDFGIFTGVLQSGIAASTSYFEKFSNCFGWGFRNLSSLGSNLQPSSNGWENLFTTFISIVGLLLFLYLIGNLQMYMQFETARREDHKHKMVMNQRIEKKGRETEMWLFKKGIPTRLHKDMKPQIMEKVQVALVENRDANLDNILSLLPLDLQRKIESYMLPLIRLKQVPILEEMDEPVLKAIFEHLKPMKYSNSDIIFQEGQPLDIMLFVVDGLINIEKRDCATTCQRGAGELCGEELLEWPSLASFPSGLPWATESAKATGDVEALALSAKDLESIGSEFRRKFYFDSDRAIIFFTWKELEEATHSYSRSRVLGDGILATVYKGVLPLPSRRLVAVKRLKTTVYGDTQLFAFRIKHENMERFLGGCWEIPNKTTMVFEYIPNGNLHQHIHKIGGKGLSPPLSLELRLKIAAETARALEYLHEYSLMHGDVRTKTILLDNNYTAKLCHIVTSPSFGEIPGQYATGGLQWRNGYLDPEFQLGKLGHTSDVYSFGVVLAELLTSKAAYASGGGEPRLLASLFVSSMEKGQLSDILDHEVVIKGKFETAMKVAHLAKRCLAPTGDKRPTMIDVVAELEDTLPSISPSVVSSRTY